MSVGIFVLGCLFYYVLTNGRRPFETESNILQNAKDLNDIESFGREGFEAIDLVTSMLSPEALQQ